MKFLVVLVLSCCSLGVLQAQEHGEEGGEGGETAPEVSPCAISRERLETVARALFPEEYTVTINCLSFNENGMLERGIVSGVNSTGELAVGMRLVLTCVENVIVSTQSSQPPVNSEANETACLNCADVADQNAICVEECESPCERCYGVASNCTRCLACVASSPQGCIGSNLECAETCRNQATVTNPELFNFCDCPSGYYRELLNFPESDPLEGEVEVPEECQANPDLDNFRCVTQCTGGRMLNEELNHCFACGLEYCVRCDPTQGTHGYCLSCLDPTVLFDHECFACPLGTVALNAHNQEEELEEELRDQRLRQIELAISLPIVSVLVVIFFVGMSVFAHYRYPHIASRGHKRHRTKPEDLDSIIPPENDSAPNTPSDVWRSRPTVRLR